MHPVGSHCMDISRCTVNKTLNFEADFVKIRSSVLETKCAFILIYLKLRPITSKPSTFEWLIRLTVRWLKHLTKRADWTFFHSGKKRTWFHLQNISLEVHKSFGTFRNKLRETARFSLWCWWRFESSEMWHRVTGWLVADVSKDRSSLIPTFELKTLY